MTATSLIFDYLQNIEKKEVDTILHIEDSIEMKPNSTDIASIYTLYEVTFKDEEPTYYIATATSSANIINKANEELLQGIFPDFFQEKFGTRGSESIPTTDSPPTA